MNENRVSLQTARNKLIKLWGFGSFVPLCIIIMQTVLGKKYDGIAPQVWGWFSPLIFPTLTLMIGVIGAAALDQQTDAPKTVSKSFLNITLSLCAFYLLIIILVVAAEPFGEATDPVKSYTTSNLFLTPVQAATTAALGFLFSSTKAEGNKEKSGS